ncbi:hypothetical protein VTN02DRAFT_908 [Thermoascus thermophilus]
MCAQHTSVPVAGETGVFETQCPFLFFLFFFFFPTCWNWKEEYHDGSGLLLISARTPSSGRGSCRQGNGIVHNDAHQQHHRPSITITLSTVHHLVDASLFPRGRSSSTGNYPGRSTVTTTGSGQLSATLSLGDSWGSSDDLQRHFEPSFITVCTLQRHISHSTFMLFTHSSSEQNRRMIIV